MTDYRRFYTPNSTWFFTVNLAERRIIYIASGDYRRGMQIFQSAGICSKGIFPRHGKRRKNFAKPE